MRPRIVRMERRIDRDVINALRAFESASGEYFGTFAMDALFRGDMKSRYEAYQVGTQSWLTRNEARAAEGKNPIEGLDEPLVPVNMETVSQAATRSAANNFAKMNSAKSATAEDDTQTEDDEQDAGGSPETPSDDGPAEDASNARLRETKLRALAIASAGRVVRREVKALRKLAIKANEGHGINVEVLNFYHELGPVVADALAISAELAEGYCREHIALIVNAQATDAGLDLEIDRIEEEAPVALAELAMGKIKKSERGVLIS